MSFEQPAGTFYFGTAPASEVGFISKAIWRTYNPVTKQTEGGIQREVVVSRLKAIADYANTRDASFPTPIILALREGTYSLDGDLLTVNGEGVADIVDGQHRIEGLKLSNRIDQFQLLVVFLIEPTEEEKALIFATINGKQTPVPASVVYDLFGVTNSRSPQKTAHEIARALNTSEESPWQGRLKMLGKKTVGSEESLTQGTFIKFLLPLISANPAIDLENMKDGSKPIHSPNLAFNQYFYDEKDESILRIMTNLFKAVSEVWPEEWADPKTSILTKTTGYTGIMKALPEIITTGKRISNLSNKFFLEVFKATKSKIESDGNELKSAYFQSNSVGEDKFKNYILSALKSIDFDKVNLE